jgi:hypothetical protein
MREVGTMMASLRAAAPEKAIVLASENNDQSETMSLPNPPKNPAIAKKLKELSARLSEQIEYGAADSTAVQALNDKLGQSAVERRSAAPSIKPFWKSDDKDGQVELSDDDEDDSDGDDVDEDADNDDKVDGGRAKAKKRKAVASKDDTAKIAKEPQEKKRRVATKGKKMTEIQQTSHNAQQERKRARADENEAAQSAWAAAMADYVSLAITNAWTERECPPRSFFDLVRRATGEEVGVETKRLQDSLLSIETEVQAALGHLSIAHQIAAQVATDFVAFLGATPLEFADWSAQQQGETPTQEQGAGGSAAGARCAITRRFVDADQLLEVTTRRTGAPCSASMPVHKRLKPLLEALAFVLNLPAIAQAHAMARLAVLAGGKEKIYTVDHAGHQLLVQSDRTKLAAAPHLLAVLRRHLDKIDSSVQLIHELSD